MSYSTSGATVSLTVGSSKQGKGMDKQIAAELIQEVLKLTAQLNVIIHKIQDVTPEADRMSLDRHDGRL